MKPERDHRRPGAEGPSVRDELIGRLLANPSDDGDDPAAGGAWDGAGNEAPREAGNEVHREAGNEAWTAFRAHAGRDVSAWEELARALHDELATRTAVERELSRRRAAAEVDRALAMSRPISGPATGSAESAATTVAGESGDPPPAAGSPLSPRTRRPRSWQPGSWRRWTGRAGWAVAAGLMLIWLVGELGPDPHATAPPGPDTSLMLPASFTADEAYDQYVSIGEKAGRVVAELPTVMVESRAMPDGTFEVLYVRQLLERETVSGVYGPVPDGADELESAPFPFLPDLYSPAPYLPGPYFPGNAHDEADFSL